MADSQQGQPAMIPLANIRENEVALRSVNRESEQFKGLVDSIRKEGVLCAISVRPMKDEKGEYFELIDGLHRFNAAQDAGLKAIPAIVKSVEKQQVLRMQVMANLHKVETRPVEFTHQLQRMMADNPTLTVGEIATDLCVSPAWIHSRLGLLKLAEDIQKLVDAGKIIVSNAFALAKLPLEEQTSFVERAMTMTPAEFAPTVNGRAKEIRDARRAGRSPGTEGFNPIPRLRKLPELRTEASVLNVLKNVLKENRAKTIEDAARVTLEWVLCIDPSSIEIQKAKFEQRAAAETQKKEHAKLERARKASEEAQKTRDALEAKRNEVAA